MANYYSVRIGQVEKSINLWIGFRKAREAAQVAAKAPILIFAGHLQTTKCSSIPVKCPALRLILGDSPLMKERYFGLGVGAVTASNMACTYGIQEEAGGMTATLLTRTKEALEALRADYSDNFEAFEKVTEVFKVLSYDQQF